MEAASQKKKEKRAAIRTTKKSPNVRDAAAVHSGRKLKIVPPFVMGFFFVVVSEQFLTAC